MAMTTASSPASQVLEMLDRAGRQRSFRRCMTRLPQNLGFAHHGAVLPGRQEIRGGRGHGEGLLRHEGQGRKSAGPEDRQRWSPSMACASPWKTAPGAWCALPPTSRRWWWWWKARPRKPRCGAIFKDIDTRLCRSIPKWASTTQKIVSFFGRSMRSPARVRNLLPPQSAPAKWSNRQIREGGMDRREAIGLGLAGAA